MGVYIGVPLFWETTIFLNMFYIPVYIYIYQGLRFHIHAVDRENQKHLIPWELWHFSIARSCRIFGINSMYVCTCSCVSRGYTDAVGIMIMQAHLGADEASTIDIHVWLPVHVRIAAGTLSLHISTVQFPGSILFWGLPLHPGPTACFGV